ncbi:MAG: hydantoinase B/oxoprolinase family protein [Rhizobiales bacterium]|nr:hydantoinase B/oxoprolinase family protein [Hyphomicrobiales bacterium]
MTVVPKFPVAIEVDPIALEIIRHGLQSIPEEIEVDLTRTAYSPLIYEYKDYAVGLVDAEGRLIAMPRGGIPLFLANVLEYAVKDGLRYYGREGLEPGDVVLTNDPATLGQHLNNVVMYTPVFGLGGSGDIVGFMTIIAHWTDVGGRYIGSSASTDSTDIFQEGVQFPTLKLRRRGEPVPEVYRLLQANTRFPEQTLGDMEAQLSGCLKGRALFEAMIVKHGQEQVLAAIQAMWQQSEAGAVAAVHAIPDGTYVAESFLDDDGVEVGKRIPIRISVTVQGERMTIDFSEVAGQLKGPFNSGAQGGGVTAARIAFKYLTSPSDPTNDGSFRPLDVILPDGKFLSAGPRAPLARYSAPLASVVETILRAMADAVPERIAAGHHASFGSHRFHGHNPRTGALFSHLDTALGGWGAGRDRDGSGPLKTMTHGDTLDVPVEAQEAMYPLTVEAYGFRQDSAGAGTYRGGTGLIKVYHVDASCNLAVTFERFFCPPWGLHGGSDGAPGYVEIERPGQPRQWVLKASDIHLERGDRVFIYTGGGGGYGPPSARDQALIARDIAEGYVSEQAAADVYGRRS